MELENLRVQLVSSLNALRQQENALTASIINETEQASSIKTFQNQLSTSLSNLSSIPTYFASASRTISNVYSLASDLSWRIKEVDMANSRCKEAALHIRRFADLSECMGSIGGAIEQENVPLCCDYIKRLLEIPKNLLSAEDCSKIEGYRTATLELLRRKLQTESDPARVFEYFADCGAQTEGIKEYSVFQHQQIVSKTDYDRVVLTQQKPIQNDESRAPHIEVFIKLLDVISSHILGSLSTLNDSGQFAVFIRLILELNDQKIEGIIQLYNQYRSLEKLSQTTPPAFLDMVNDEISTIAHQFSLFENFIKNRIKNGVSSAFFKNYLFKYPTILSSGMPQHTQSRRSIQELLANFVVITQFYTNVVSEELLSTISSMSNPESVINSVEDLFFVFQRLLSRSITTNSASTTCSVFNIMTNIIRDKLVSTIIQQSNSVKNADVGGKISILLNTYDLTSVYLTKLLGSVETSVIKIFSGDDLVAIRPGIEDLKRCNDSLLATREKLFDELIKSARNQLEPLIEVFKVQQWTNEQGKQINVEMESLLQGSFSKQYQAFIQTYKNALNNSNFEKFRVIFSSLFAKRFENLLLQKKFDYKGAILLDRIIKFFVSSFSHNDAFSRLKSIAYVISRESFEELADIPPQPDASFDAKEVRRYVGLRLDWQNANLALISKL